MLDGQKLTQEQKNEESTHYLTYRGIGALSVTQLPQVYWNTDTLLFLHRVLGAEWYKAGIRFHGDGSKFSYICYVNEDGSIHRLVFHFDDRFSENDKTKMLATAEFVKSKFKFKPTPGTKFNFASEANLKNP